MMKTAWLLGQLDSLTEAQRAVRDRFQQGGSGIAVFLVLLALVAVVLLTGYLTRRLPKGDGADRPLSPRKLFQKLLRQLGLTPAQRRLLQNVSRDLRLPHPTVILLSPSLFDRYVEGAITAAGRAAVDQAENSDAKLAGEIRRVLFP